MYGKISCSKCGGQNFDHICRTCNPDREHIQNLMLKALQYTYRKHCLGDDTIGWMELEGILSDALCEALGDTGFRSWMNTVKGM